MYVVCGGQTFIKLISIKFGDNNFSPKIYLNFISHHYQGIFFKISIDNRLILKNQLSVSLSNYHCFIYLSSQNTLIYDKYDK